MKLAISLAGTVLLGLLAASCSAPPKPAPQTVVAPVPEAAPPPAPTIDATTALAAYRRAHAAIRQALSNPAMPPSLQDAAYAQAVSRAFDVSMLEIVNDQPMLDLMGVCFQAGSTQAAYLLLGVKREELDPQGIQLRLKWDASVQARKLKSENYQQFQNELVAALRFGLACRVSILEKLDTYLPQMPSDELVAFRLSFPDFQQSLAELVTYHVSALSDPIRPENRREVVDLLVGRVELLAAGMSKETRQAVMANINKVSTGPGMSPNERGSLQAIQQAVRRKDCGRVCSFK